MTVLLYVAILLGSFLLFSVQPLTAKPLLPMLGGSPALWNTSMVFYQVILLAGYIYTHMLSKAGIASRRTLVIHALLVCSALAFMPMVIRSVGQPYEHHPILWLLSTLILTIGVPFFLLSSNAPLIQRWFNRVTNGKDPYFLYALSNIGSLSALLLYPFVIEPNIGVASQQQAWSFLFIAFCLILFCCMFGVRRSSGRTTHLAEETDTPAAPISKKTLLYWFTLSCIPSGLLQGVTFYITTDVAAVPLLWIAPLALYLLTHIIAFSGFGRYFTRINILPGIILALVLSVWLHDVLTIPLHLIVFFVTALSLHTLLAQARPAAQQLTLFYVCMSAGGAAGGLLVSIIFPLILDHAIEYQLFLLAALGIRHVNTRLKDIEHFQANPAGFLRRPYIHMAVGSVITATLIIIAMHVEKDIYEICIAFLFIFTFGSAIFYEKRADIGARLSIMLFMGLSTYSIAYAVKTSISLDNPVILSKRGFFGVNKVMKDTSNNLYSLQHGTTLHGSQVIGSVPDNTLRHAYYAPPVDIRDILPERIRNKPYALIGLGTGILACYADKGQEADLYEIDPNVINIAKDTRYFTYLKDCPGTYTILGGDGRLRINSMPDERYGVIIIDAYSSDSLPVHLATSEAISLYDRVLAPDGVLMFHVSNRHLNVYRALYPALKRAGYMSFMERFEANASEHIKMSEWVFATKNKQTYESMRDAGNRDEQTLRPDIEFMWTDDYSALLPLIK